MEHYLKGIDVYKGFGQEKWIPLELFDDRTYDEFTDEEWIAKTTDTNGNFAPLKAKVKHTQICTKRNHYSGSD